MPEFEERLGSDFVEHGIGAAILVDKDVQGDSVKAETYVRRRSVFGYMNKNDNTEQSTSQVNTNAYSYM